VSNTDSAPEAQAHKPRPTLAAVIFGTVLRLLWAATAFCLAAGVALVVLYLLGALWVGNELRAAAPHEPALHHGGAPFFGMVLFASTVTPALTALPAIAVAMVGEILRIRSWIYYVLAGGVSLAAIPLLVTPASADLRRDEPVHDDLCCCGLRRRLHLLALRWPPGLSLPCHTACFPRRQRTTTGEHSRIMSMNKFLVAVALLAACASPALAGSAKVRSHHGYNGYSSYRTPDWVRPLPHSERLANALGGWNRGYPGDPYWEPCLSYQRTWGPGACGGGH